MVYAQKCTKKQKGHRLIHEIKVIARANIVVCKYQITSVVQSIDLKLLFYLKYWLAKKTNTIKENDLIYLHKTGNLQK